MVTVIRTSYLILCLSVTKVQPVNVVQGKMAVFLIILKRGAATEVPCQQRGAGYDVCYRDSFFSTFSYPRVLKGSQETGLFVAI
jgi:hypothetical protein